MGRSATHQHIPWLISMLIRSRFLAMRVSMGRHWRLLAALITVAAPSLIWWGWFRRLAADESAALLDRQSAAHQAALRDAGVPIQLARIDAVIAQVAHYRSYDEVVAGLLDRPGGRTAFDIVLAVSMQTQDAMPETSFLQVLADRRFARMIGYLNETPRAEAARRAAATFDEQLEAHRLQWEHLMVMLREGHAADKAIRNRLGMPLSVRYTRHAVCLSLMLCAWYAEPAVVLRKLDGWRAMIEEFRLRLDAEPALKGSVHSEWVFNSGPERLFVFNLLLLVADRHQPRLSEDAIAALPGDLPKLLRLERRPLTRWDAETNPFDFTAVHRGVPIDEQDALGEVRFRRGWDFFQAQPTGQDQIIEHLRAGVSKLTRTSD
jgi:hypothetical protein